MDKEKVLKELKKCIEMNLNHVLDDNPSEIEEIKIGDIFGSTAWDGIDYYDEYFILKENNGKLYLIECDENGICDEDEFDFNDYNSLDYYIEKNALY